MAVALPFLTESHPALSGEGAIDPLGFAPLGDRLAEWLLPGMAVRMSRPRFLTAIAVAAAVCEPFNEEDIAADGVSTPQLVFEWLMLEGFARAADRNDVRQTPGIEKATLARKNGLPMSARTYLKSPSVFGFHGVYKRLARSLQIVDSQFRLRENGFVLLRSWEQEQGLPGFSGGDSESPGGAARRMLSMAVRDSLQAGYVDRRGWQGWEFFARHLAPAKQGRQEATLLRRMLIDASGGTRGELFRLVEAAGSELVDLRSGDGGAVKQLLQRASLELVRRLEAVIAFESFASSVDEAFDWIRFASSQAGARSISAADVGERPRVREIAHDLSQRLTETERRVADAPPEAGALLSEIARQFCGVRSPEDLFGAILERHAAVQKAKPPEGKREWFERGLNDSVFVRPRFRMDGPPPDSQRWRRPYRISAVHSFCGDLQEAAR